MQRRSEAASEGRSLSARCESDAYVFFSCGHVMLAYGDVMPACDHVMPACDHVMPVCNPYPLDSGSSSWPLSVQLFSILYSESVDTL